MFNTCKCSNNLSRNAIHPRLKTWCSRVYIEEAEDGRLYIAMALYSGMTLKDVIEGGPASVDKVISIGIQIASALDRAHGQGIVHRDIKSANIMLTDQEEIKILDFGLAKLSGGIDLTKTGSTVGTAAYMSPEQVRSLTVDFKSDLWSLGIILYELLSGTRPFQGEYEASIGYSILNEQPAPLSSSVDNVPPELDEILNQLLAKDPDERSASADLVVKALSDLRLDRTTESRGSRVESVRINTGEKTSFSISPLKWAMGIAGLILVALVLFLIGRTDRQPDSATGLNTSDEYSIAVLPFTDLSPNTDNQYFGEGMAEELRNALMGLGGLRVAARASSFYFQGKGLSPQAIGDSLSVGMVLEGTIRQEGETIRVTAELTNSETGFGIWSNRYDRQMDDVLAVQDEISREIVDALEIELNVDQNTGTAYEVNPEAYRLYLEGKYYYNKRTLADLEVAQELFDKAIDIDDQYAPTYAFRSQTLTILVAWGFNEPLDTLPLSIGDARRAIDLDSGLPDAYAALGIALGYDWQWDEAMTSFERALQLEPDHAIAHLWKSLDHFIMGELDQGYVHISRASELDPLSLIIGINYVWGLNLMEEPILAKQEYDQVRNLHGNHAGLAIRLSEGYEKVGRIRDAIGVLEEFESPSPFVNVTLARLYGKAGKDDEARNLLSAVSELRGDQYVPITIDAYIYAWFGEKGAALAAFETAFREKDPMLKWFQFSFLPPEYQSDRRMRDIIKQIGLPVD